MSVHAKFKACTFTCSLIGGSHKIGAVPSYANTLYLPPIKKNPYAYCPIRLLYDFIINKYRLFIYVFP